jgi:hypothetical protein
MSNLGRVQVGLLATGALILTAACNEHRDTGAVTSKVGDKTTSAPPAEAVEKRDMRLDRTSWQI